jgi:hypothetical protein
MNCKCPQVPLPEHNDIVKTFPADGADQALRSRMPRERTRRTNRLAVRRRWGSASRWRSRTTAVGRDRRRGTLDSLATIGVKQPKNLAIVCLDNGHYSASGVQPSATKAGVDLAEAARACSCRVRDIGLTLAAHLIPERRIARAKRARCQ